MEAAWMEFLVLLVDEIEQMLDDQRQRLSVPQRRELRVLMTEWVASMPCTQRVLRACLRAYKGSMGA